MQVVRAINITKEAIYNKVSLGYYSFRVEGEEGKELFLYYMTHILWCVVLPLVNLPLWRFKMKKNYQTSCTVRIEHRMQMLRNRLQGTPTYCIIAQLVNLSLQKLETLFRNGMWVWHEVFVVCRYCSSEAFVAHFTWGFFLLEFWLLHLRVK